MKKEAPLTHQGAFQKDPRQKEAHHKNREGLFKDLSPK
jgi:hypothetical protein